jgi:nucleoside phosphorylase
MTIKRIGIIVAMDKEFAQLRTLLDDAREEQNHHKTFVIGQMDGREIIMQQCGIGKVNSAIGTVEMINLYHPNLIISTGCAGGADVSLNPLDVVVASSCVYHDAYCGDNVTYGQVMGMPERYDAPHELVDRALSVTMPEGAADQGRPHRQRRLVCRLTRENARGAGPFPPRPRLSTWRAVPSRRRASSIRRRSSPSASSAMCH